MVCLLLMGTFFKVQNGVKFLKLGLKHLFYIRLKLFIQMLISVCAKNTSWRDAWKTFAEATQFDLLRPILVIYWRWGLRKITPPCILAFWGYSFCDPVDPQNWMLCWPPFPLLSICVSENRFPVCYKIQETFQCKAPWFILTSFLFVHSLCFPLQCYHDSVVSRPFSQGVTIRSSTEENIFKCEISQTDYWK